ncbi:hypothetical protein [Fodinicola acaciae]|uniref:hypothetical protein n=1 Tax=Fodinicola acaciae TaxID=2681555 RepID=UPI0013D704FE|nr:hypothetical protein [Fodinicola acaciae]
MTIEESSGLRPYGPMTVPHGSSPSCVDSSRVQPQDPDQLGIRQRLPDPKLRPTLAALQRGESSRPGAGPQLMFTILRIGPAPLPGSCHLVNGAGAGGTAGAVRTGFPLQVMGSIDASTGALPA